MSGHGGNIYQAAAKLGINAGKIIDFSASINPLGLPKSARDAIKKNFDLLAHYPEPFAGSLASDIAGHYGLSRDSVVCGNGSSELIHLMPWVLKPRRILITAPTFSEYEKACRGYRRTSVMCMPLKAEDNFDVNVEEFIIHMKGSELAFLCNPNNPTGRLISRKDVLRIASAAEAAGCRLVVDEAFMDFCPGDSVIKDVRNNPCLIVLRSLTKFYAMAGLRLGFGVFHPELAARMKAFKDPWTVNTLAAAAGKAVVADNAYKARTLEYMNGEKAFLEENFRRLGIRYIPSSSNYYLLMMDNAGEIVMRLSKKGILLRNCSNFKGLGDGFVRIAVRTRRENKILIRELAGL